MTTVLAAITNIYPTADQRRAALIELADIVDTEDRHPNAAPISPVLSLILPSLAGANCTDTTRCFNELVAAVAEFRRFVGNEDDWLVEHEFGQSAEVRAAVYERLQSNVDSCADALMTGRQA